MNAVIFAGPSIRNSDIAALCDALILPPAAMGDVYRAARRRPRAIGIIDGYFEGAPSVWHKEILWAMAEGIAVFGAASMGALRAAELARFGMRGIGGIFTDYLSGKLEDDDEVAVEHGPAEMGYITLSEPMVNIRASLERAMAEGIVSQDLGHALIHLAKQQFYKERNWDNLLRLARAAGIAESDLDRLAGWLPGNRIDRKRDDALKLAVAMAEFLTHPQEPSSQDFALEWTVMWDKATRSFIARDGTASATEGAIGALILDELRLDPDRYGVVRRSAIARRLLEAGGPPDHSLIEEPALRQEISHFRARHGLMTHKALMQWLTDNGLDETAFVKLIADEIRLAKAGGTGHGLERCILAELQLAGTYSALARRAREKQTLLDTAGNGQWHNRLHIMQARLWYFESALRQPLPDDMAHCASDMGFVGIEDLDRAILREFAFQSLRKTAGIQADTDI